MGDPYEIEYATTYMQWTMSTVCARGDTPVPGTQAVISSHRSVELLDVGGGSWERNSSAPAVCSLYKVEFAAVDGQATIKNLSTSFVLVIAKRWAQWPANMKWDLAVLHLSKPVKPMSFMPLAVSDTFAGARINIAGYPADKPAYTQWRSSCVSSDDDPDDAAMNITGLMFCDDHRCYCCVGTSCTSPPRSHPAVPIQLFIILRG
jgi:hypothetical protein